MTTDQRALPAPFSPQIGADFRSLQRQGGIPENFVDANRLVDPFNGKDAFVIRDREWQRVERKPCLPWIGERDPRPRAEARGTGNRKRYTLHCAVPWDSLASPAPGRGIDGDPVEQATGKRPRGWLGAGLERDL